MDMKPNEYNDGDLLEDIQYEIKEPEMWRVVLFNDDYTPREFVIKILVSVFNKTPIEATNITNDVHNKGKGMVGLYPYDIARTKLAQLRALAKENEFPLRGKMEKA